jgi:hypothetical protein
LAAGSVLFEPLLGLLIESLFDESTNARAAGCPRVFLSGPTCFFVEAFPTIRSSVITATV